MLKKLFFYPALFIICWIYAVKFNDIDYDFFARIAVGKMFFQTGNVLPHDIFSYTVTREWIDHEWGSGVIFYFFGNYFGDFGLIMLKVLLIFIIMFLISRITKLHNPKPGAHLNILFYFLIVLSTFYGLCHTVRCQLFTFTFFTLYLYVLERVRLGENRLLWIIPPIMLIWANVHGGFVAGIGLLLMYGVGEFLNKKPYWKYLLTIIPTSLITLINPYGWKYLKYIFFATTMDRSGIGEWQRTELFGPLYEWYQIKLVILLTIVSLVFYFFKNKPKFKELDKTKFIVLGMTLFLALSRIKLQAFFVISAACFVYHDFYDIFKSLGAYIKAKTGEIGSKVLQLSDTISNGIIYAIILGAGCIFIPNTPVDALVPINKFPVGSIKFIKDNKIKGNLLTIFHWGSYVAWEVYPDSLIAMDGRFEEVYPMMTYYYVSAITHHQSLPKRNFYWDSVLDFYHTDLLVLGKNNTGRYKDQIKAYHAMKNKKGWRLVYDGIVDAVFIREELVKDNYVQPTFDKHRLLNGKYQTELDFSK